MPDNDVTDERMDARLRSAGAAWRAGLDTTPTGSEPATPVPVGPAARAGARRHRRVTLLASAAVVAAALVLLGSLVFRTAGDNPTGGTSGAQASPVGTVWRLVGYGDDQRLPNSSGTLYLARDGRLVADDSCSLLTAHADLRGGRLQVTKLSLRYKPCTDSVGEATFARAVGILKGQPEYAVDGDALTIGSMHLVAAPNLPAPSPDIPTLVGATWQLVRVTGADGHAHPLTGAPTLRLSEGKLSASTGCGAMRARVEVSGQQLTLTDSQASAGPVCSGTRVATAHVVQGVLGGSALRAQLRGTTLTISRSGAGQLRYTWVPDDPRVAAPASLTGTTWRLVSIAGRPASARATLRVASDGGVTGSDGCRDFAGHARLGTGVMTLTGMPSRPPSGCAGADQASTIDSFLTSPPVRWAVRDGRLLIFGGGAQAFSLVYEAQSD